jgi:hypothetical protein
MAEIIEFPGEWKDKEPAELDRAKFETIQQKTESVDAQDEHYLLLQKYVKKFSDKKLIDEINDAEEIEIVVSGPFFKAVIEEIKIRNLDR